MRTTSFDTCLGNPGVDVRPSPIPVIPSSVWTEDNDIVLCRGRLILLEVGYEQGVTLDVGYFHR